MGYWIILAMIVCAIAMVVVAIAREEDAADGTLGGLIVPVIRVRWTAFLPAVPTEPPVTAWPDQIAATQPAIELEIRWIEDQTLSAILEDENWARPAGRIEIVTLLPGLGDLLAGTELGRFERSLAEILATAEAAEIVVILGNLPDLSRWVSATEAGLSNEDLLQLTDRWNGTIARLADQYDAELVDLFDISPGDGPGGIRRDLSAVLASAEIQDALAHRFRPAIARAIRTQRFGDHVRDGGPQMYAAPVTGDRRDGTGW